MQNWKVVFWRVDPWDARFDCFDSFFCHAENEDAAVSCFRAECGDEHVVQCVVRVQG